MTIPFSDLVSVLPRTIGGGLSGQDYEHLPKCEGIQTK